INLEDIAAPICFEVEDRVKAALDIPVMHDDQHGTAVVALAALINATKVTDRQLKDCRIVVVGSGAAGTAVIKLLQLYAKPEIIPDEAKRAGVAIMATGRSDFPNQVNNALAFPGIFRGALDNRVKAITDQHKIAAAEAIARLVEKPTPENIIPSVLDKRLVPT